MIFPSRTPVTLHPAPPSLPRVWAQGDIYKAAYTGWYCIDCEEYKDEKEMDEAHNCPVHRRPCAERAEENYFFRWGAVRGLGLGRCAW